MRSLRSLLLCVLALCYLLTGGNGRVRILCLEADGCVRVEDAGESCCTEAGDPAHGDGDATLATGDAACACVDIPLPSSADGDPRSASGRGAANSTLATAPSLPAPSLPLPVRGHFVPEPAVRRAWLSSAPSSSPLRC